MALSIQPQNSVKNLDMGFQPITEEMRNRLIAAGLYGIPKE
jgi:ribosome recycling factor